VLTPAKKIWSPDIQNFKQVENELQEIQERLRRNGNAGLEHS